MFPLKTLKRKDIFAQLEEGGTVQYALTSFVAWVGFN